MSWTQEPKKKKGYTEKTKKQKEASSCVSSFFIFDLNLYLDSGNTNMPVDDDDNRSGYDITECTTTALLCGQNAGPADRSMVRTRPENAAEPVHDHHGSFPT